MDNMAKLSTEIPALRATHWRQRLAPHLVDGERIVALASARRLRPTTEGVAITNARVLGFNTAAEPGEDVIAVSVCADEIEGYDLTSDRLVPTLTVHTPHGPEVFGTFEKTEAKFLAYFLDTLRDNGIDPAAAAGIDGLRRAAELARQAESQRLVDRQHVAVFGEPVTDAQWTAIEAHAPGDEHPWLLLNCGRSGQLAAYDDRVVVLKKDRNISSSDVQVGEFPLGEITGIDYRCGALTGLLQVHTAEDAEPEHDGFWPAARYAPDHNPWTRTDTLPLPKPYYQGAKAQLDELRGLIRDARSQEPSRS